MKQIHGIFAVTVTHFQENGEIDYAACAKHINWLIESGVHGLLPLGATGEFSALTLEERKAFAEFAMKEVAGRVPVIIGAVSTNVDVTLEVAKHAASIGADGVMISPSPACSQPGRNLRLLQAHLRKRHPAGDDLQQPRQQRRQHPPRNAWTKSLICRTWAS